MSAKIIILCEDSRTNRFVRRFLSHRFKTHDIDTLPIPTKGSGEQWVREEFPKELQRIGSREGAILIVVTDEDTDVTGSRRTSLDRQRTRTGIAPRRPNDPVIVAIGRRNIESWLWHLRDGHAIDESTDYKLRLGSLNKSSIHALADALFRMCHHEQRLRSTAPPSLREACREYPNLTLFLR